MLKLQTVTNCYAYYIRDFLNKTWRGHPSMVTHVFSNFKVPKIFEKKIMQKNLILHFFEMSASEVE